MLKKKWFTLVEMLLVVLISGSLFTTIYAIMTTLPKIKLFNETRQKVIEESNNVVNRLAILLQDYTIDYEEYFNRTKVGCTTATPANAPDQFKRTVWDQGHCTLPSYYGNWSRTLTRIHSLLYCSSSTTNPSFDDCRNWYSRGGLQSYGQYKTFFRDIGQDTDGLGKGDEDKRIGDADDKDLWKGPTAIYDPQNIKELYLISHDGQRRLLIRRKQYVKTIDDTIFTGATIQILKLRGFDAGSQHKFTSTDHKTYDGEIDTWACDYVEGFECNGLTISPNFYPNFKLPKDQEDWWVDLFDNGISIEDRNIQIIPTKKPNYAWAEDDQQINPYIKLYFTAKIAPTHLPRAWRKTFEQYRFSLQTSFDTKWFYVQS